MKDLPTEHYQIVRKKKPIYPKNLYLKREPMKHTEYHQKVTKKQIGLTLSARDLEKARPLARRIHLVLTKRFYGRGVCGVEWLPVSAAQRSYSLFAFSVNPCLR